MEQHNVQITDHLLESARQVPSPNCGDRPDESDIDLVVIHSISLPPGQYGGEQIERFFSNELNCAEHPYFQQIEGLQVSAHLFIRRNGEVVQFVPFNRRAWHAGESSYQGRVNCNDFSVGIELEGTDIDVYEQEQYQQLAKVCCALVAAYPKISLQGITGHSDISPGRKTDPGIGFDWQFFLSLLSKAPEEKGKG